MMKNMKTGMLLLSICYVVVGLLLLVMPAASLPWICTAFSVVILLTGAVNLVQYFRLRGQGVRSLFMMVGGVVATGLGVVALMRPEYVEWVLPVVFGLFVAMDGIIRITSAWRLMRRHGQRWWVLTLLSIVTLLFAAELLTFPFLPFKVIDLDAVMLCGIILVIEGMLNMGCLIYAAMELHALDRLDAVSKDKAEAIPVEVTDVTTADTADVVAEAKEVTSESPVTSDAPTAPVTPEAPAASETSTSDAIMPTPDMSDMPIPEPTLTTNPDEKA